MNNIRGVLYYFVQIHRRPRSRKVAWVLTVVWGTALTLPGLSVALNPARGLDMTIWVGWSNLICIFLDGFMLCTSVLGLRWIYAQPAPGADTISG